MHLTVMGIKPAENYALIYYIAGDFWGVHFSRIGDLLTFYGSNFTDAHNCANTHIMQTCLFVGLIFVVRESTMKSAKIGPLKNYPLYSTIKSIYAAQCWQRVALKNQCNSSQYKYFIPLLVDSGENWSLIGMQAARCSDKCTMQLSLGYKDSLKKHYVIHEFGHALGLGHEHQRSVFWKILFPFVYLELMENDQHIGGADRFNKDWIKKYYSSDIGEESDPYDPQSIMHYWLVDLVLPKSNHHVKNSAQLLRVTIDYRASYIYVHK